MKDSVKEYLWMLVVSLCTAIWNFCCVASIVHFIKYNTDWLMTAIFIIMFLALTFIWDFLVIPILVQFFKTHKIKE